MGRTASFDPDAALVAALETFWRRGYAASSVQVLLEAMGLGRGSLYNSFGDKQTLFRAALDLYFERSTAVVLGLLETTENPVEGLYGVFEWTLIALPEGERRRGCLLVNTVAELADTEPELAAHAYAHLAKVRDALAGALARADQAGLWPRPTASAEIVAEALFAQLTGLRVAARLHADPARLRASVLATLDSIGLDTGGIRR